MTEWRAALLERLSTAPQGEQDGILTEALRDRGMFEALLVETVSQGIFVGFGLASGNGVAGGFTVQNGVPSIALHRANASGIVDDPVFEVLTLAHEGGHADSWRQGYRTAPYVAVVDRALEPEARFESAEALLILDEECRAWLYGRARLCGVGFMKWDRFEERKAEALEIYCTRLGLPEGHWKERYPTCTEGPRDPRPQGQCDACDGAGWKPESGPDLSGIGHPKERSARV
jgi:hypothetical protein